MSATTDVPLLDVRDLETHFHTKAGVVKAVDGVSFTVAASEIVGLVGESGSGKSVTGFSVLGLIDAPGRIAGGSIKLNGRELVGLSHGALRSMRGREIAMVFQDPSTTLNPVLTIGRQMRLALAAHERLSDKAANARAAEVLAQVGIPDARRRLEAYPHQFSGGMRQRVAIAIALLNRPKLMVCDEPTTALDVSIQAQVLAEMKSLAQSLGTAMIWISHDLATVSSLASRLLVMYAGRIIEEGSAATVLRAPRHPYTRGLLDSLPGLAARGQELRQIPGTTPSLLKMPPGCAFAPRCAYSSGICTTAPERVASDNRAVRCHHPLAPLPAKVSA
jgi:peptide/nickel transport system ATP-binding protein